MNQDVLTALEAIEFDPKSPANISYVKARMVIDETAKCRKDRRAAKMSVVALLKGHIVHLNTADTKKGHKVQVEFPDGTKARF